MAPRSTSRSPLAAVQGEGAIAAEDLHVEIVAFGGIPVEGHQRAGVEHGRRAGRPAQGHRLNVAARRGVGLALQPQRGAADLGPRAALAPAVDLLRIEHHRRRHAGDRGAGLAEARTASRRGAIDVTLPLRAGAGREVQLAQALAQGRDKRDLQPGAGNGIGVEAQARAGEIGQPDLAQERIARWRDGGRSHGHRAEEGLGLWVAEGVVGAVHHRRRARGRTGEIAQQPGCVGEHRRLAGA